MPECVVTDHVEGLLVHRRVDGRVERAGLIEAREDNVGTLYRAYDAGCRALSGWTRIDAAAWILRAHVRAQAEVGEPHRAEWEAMA